MARALTGARYGAIYAPTVPQSSLNFVTSALRRRNTERWLRSPTGVRLFEHLHGLGTPRRLPDLAGYARSLGCSPLPVPCGALLGTSMCQRDTTVGGFFLVEKKGGFTDRGA